MTDISKNVQTLIKKAYHVPSTYHNTKWYNETSHIYQNTFEANDINVQTVPTTPVWLDVSSSESSLYELGIAITTSDSFAVTDASFIETISGDVYYDDYQKSPGAYIDSTGTVMLFVRLKLDKMITDSENSDYGVDTNAIAYVKYGASNLILNGSFEEGATDVNGYEFSSATGGVPNWTTDVSDRVVFIEDGNNAWSSGDDVVATYDDDWLIGLQYKDTSISQTVGNLEAGSYNISFAVAARNHAYTTSPFLFEVKNANSGEILVDLSDTSVIAWTYKTFSFDITSHNTDITVTFTNNHSIAYDNDDNDDDDRTVFFDSVELKKQTPCSILSNSYQYNYNTQLDVSGVSDTISVFKPYNYKLEYSEDSGNTFLTSLANSVGNWAFDFKSGIVTFGNDPSDDVPSIDISNGDLYFTFVKYVGLRGVNNLDTINGDLTVGGGAIIGAPTGSTTVLAGAGGLDGMGGNQGTATASSTPNTGNGRYAYSPFNNDLSGEWWSTSLGEADEDSDYAYGYYEYLNFEFPYDVYVTNYKIWRRDADTSDNPYEWILYGSTHDESDNFIVIDEQTDVAAMYGKYDNDVTTANDNDEYQEYTVATTPAAYRHIRMVISQSNHSVGASNCIVSIGELGLYGFVAVTLNVLGGANITSDLTVGGVFTPSNISTNNTTLVIGNKNGTGEATPPYSYSWAEFQTSKLALGGNIIELRTGSDGDGITGGNTVRLEDSLMTVTGAANISSDLAVGGDTDISGDLVVSKSVSVTNADENTYTSDNLLSFGEDDLSPTLRWSKSDAENCGVGASRTPSTLILTPVNNNDGFIEFYMGRSWSGDRNNNRGTTFRHYRDANFAGNDGASHNPDRLDIFVSGDNGHSNGASAQTVDATPNITFTADNYVGINTKQPTYGLHVETEAYISSDLTVGGTVNSTNTILDATNVTSKTLTLIGGSSSSYEYKQASYFHAGDKTYGYGLIKTSGNDTFGFCVNADDDSPNSLLEIDLNGSMAVAKDLTVGGSLQLDGNFTIGDGTENEYIYMHGSASTLKLSAFDGRVDIKHTDNIAFSIDSTLVNGTGEIMRITSTGLGIGETSPGYPLHVDANGGSVTGYYLDTKGDKDLYNTDVDDGDDNADVYKDTNEALSIYSSGSVGINSGKYYYLSDERIKTNIRDISDDEALVAFRKLQPKTYNYKDPLKSGYNSVYGFIAQEVAEVIPNSTMKDTGFIPNIYRACEIDNSINILTFHFGTSGETIEQFDLSINDIIQIEDVNKNMIERTIIDIIDDYSIQVNDEYIPAHTHDSSGIELSYNQVFVYGKRIDDLHRLGKDSIWTVAAAALQEVDRQQQADKVRISELESEVTTLKNQVSTFETQMSELLARVSAMENNNSTTTTDVSDNTTTTDGS